MQTKKETLDRRAATTTKGRYLDSLPELQQTRPCSSAKSQKKLPVLGAVRGTRKGGRVGSHFAAIKRGEGGVCAKRQTSIRGSCHSGRAEKETQDEQDT